MINFISNVAKEAGSIILKSSKTTVRNKEHGGNIVLVSDIQSEQYILSSIQKKYPGHTILSEETPSSIDHLETIANVWIVDPLDGTTNAKHEIPFYSISIAYVQYGKVIAGGIYDLLRDEFFYAEKGKGAFCNGKPIIITDATSIDGLIINIGSPYNQENFQLTYPFGKAFHEHGARIVNFGSSALECAWVANGRLGAYLEAGLKSWDIAAANLLVSEAGGVMIDPYKKNHFSIFDQKAILVGNQKIVDVLYDVMKTYENK
ncbi:MAG: Myo-inositol-monophosphatase [Candidatus Wolfebacteria bacterium GW2011_GWC1_43_10]|uniref:Inositol-1-monophosphatase n=1 Tax=Candidatus Wolfebacteria bacterium GW2011_GWC1_43_10 TaxID=1619011 RepID=A0A0G1EDU8_9BACT|nr:MAG: Myo-inositol-monophosphatase [Microgenomates group bacterium GW2011_GWB1_40_9]KKS81226.1 MAG: Myo-inositol-monophosphatase [Candidatus Wolfebacteria bacterium GW2011_GWC1_43_10]